MTVPPHSPKTGRYLGKSIPRLDGSAKVRGLAEFADDVPVPGLWHGALVRAPVPCGRLLKLSFDEAFDWGSVCVVTPDDIPGENIVDMMGKDMPLLAHDRIQYLGEPVALVAAPTRARARIAAEHVTVACEEQPPVLTLEEVVAGHRAGGQGLKKLWGQTIRRGDMDEGWAAADFIVEGEYWAGHQEQMYIEPQGMTATPEDGGVFLHGSLQCPYFINPELCVTLALPPEKIRVKQTAVGGAFGGKEEFPTLLGGYCALLAMKSGRPVRIVYERQEDILYTTKRHPCWVRHRTGLTADGAIAAMDVEYVLDGGAYTTLSPVVLFRGILHAAMGYRCDHVAVDGLVYRTNTFPGGAFRGFGAPQAYWALESHVDELADRCGMTPHAFRLRNCLRQGDKTPTGQLLKESVGSPAVLTEALQRAGYEDKFKRCSRGRSAEGPWYGIGLSFFAHGSGFTGDGEARIKATAAVELERFDDGLPGVNVLASSTEMGQGTFTILPQAVADGLSVSLDRVQCPPPDTSVVPDSGPTVASRTAMVVGSIVYRAAEKMKKALETYAGDVMFNGQVPLLENGTFVAGGLSVSFEEVAGRYLDERGPLRTEHRFELPEGLQWNQETFEGDAYPAYSWGCNIAEVEVDVLTMEVRVSKVTAVYDAGRILNPMLAKGQVEGGLVQALGYAVMEKIGIRDGRFDADKMQTYVIPTALDIPEFDIGFVEFPYDHAWPGAKGLGEVPMDGLAPAIGNAIKQATGSRFRHLPMTPEVLYEALKRHPAVTRGSVRA